ncbi:hypothetical protein HA402_009096 [Bradysia odoriphaga]|nr:hypothetical protein HA402_009096 [Bradysia odoriphaga]
MLYEFTIHTHFYHTPFVGYVIIGYNTTFFWHGVFESVALFKPVIHREDARLEEEGIPSKVLSVYDNSQLKVGDFLNSITIQEHEKYGNTGDKFYPVGRAIVNGYEGFSNVLNKLLDSPIEVAKTISRGITDSLNNVGGKIVGLNR